MTDNLTAPKPAAESREGALREIVERILGGGAWSEADCLPLVREAFALGWNTGAKAQRQADVTFTNTSKYRDPYSLYCEPLVTLDDAKERT